MNPVYLICLFITIEAQVNPIKEGEKQTFILTEETFTSLIQHSSVNEDWFVLLYSPKCGHCTKFKPTFYNSAFSHQGSVNFGEINCEYEKDLCSRLRVQYYPYLILIKNKMIHEFKGKRTLEDLKNFIEEGYASVQANKIPTEMPTTLENFSTAFDELKRDIVMSMKQEGNYAIKAMIVLFFVIIIAVFVTIGYMILEICRARKQYLEDQNEEITSKTSALLSKKNK